MTTTLKDLLELPNNQLTNLPDLPLSLRTLWYENNQLTSLPKMPNKLKDICRQVIGDKELIVLAFHGCISEYHLTPTTRMILHQHNLMETNNDEEDLVVLAFYGYVSINELPLTAHVMLCQRKYHSPMEAWYDGDCIVWHPQVPHSVFHPWKQVSEEYKCSCSKIWRILPDKRQAWIINNRINYNHVSPNLAIQNDDKSLLYRLELVPFKNNKLCVIRAYQNGFCRYARTYWDIPLFDLFIDKSIRFITKDYCNKEPPDESKLMLNVWPSSPNQPRLSRYINAYNNFYYGNTDWYCKSLK